MANEMIVKIDGVEINDPDAKQAALFLRFGDYVQLGTSKRLYVNRSYPKHTGEPGKKIEWTVTRLSRSGRQSSIESPAKSSKVKGLWVQLNVDDLEPEAIGDDNYKVALLHTTTGSLFTHNGKTLLVVERIFGIDENSSFLLTVCESVV